MHKMLCPIIVMLVLISMSYSLDNFVRLYDSFAEIHQEYNRPLRFRQSDWNNIKHESIMLRLSSDSPNDDSIITFERRVTRLQSNTTGKTVFVRRYPEHKNPIACEIINEENIYSLVRQIDTGHYFRVQSHLIEYTDEPQSDQIYEVSFHPLVPNRTLIVSYILKNLRWQARYSLQTYSNHPTQFQVLIDIINTSPFTYQFNKTHLMSGDINLSFATSKSSSLVDATMTKTPNMDYNGIYLFLSLNNSLKIDPYSILTMPIHSPSIHIKTIYIYTLVLKMPIIVSNNSVSTFSNKDQFRRLYQLSNGSSFLPTGHLLLYDSSANILTGEWHLPTLAESEKYEFKLGEDSDVVIDYNSTIVNNPTINSSLITTNILVQNYKQRKINIRFKSVCESSSLCAFYDDKARSIGPRLAYELTLKSKSEVAFSFTTIRLF